MDTEYINGVRNEDGELVMRPLTDEEKEFLNKFYQETVNANFLHDPELKSLHNKIKEVQQLDNPTEEDFERLDYLNLLYLEKAEEALLYSGEKDQKRIYGENNARNRCLYNRSKSSGSLSHIEDTQYNDEDESNSIYVCKDSGKNILKDKIELKKEKKYILRKKKDD